MKPRRIPVIFLVGVMATCAGSAWGQGKTLSVSYLRAAVGAIPNRASVSVMGDYSGASGLVSAHDSYLRNKGYSRFTITDPDTGVTFDAIYCEHDSNVFNELVGVKGTKRYVFHGYRRNIGRLDAVVVTSLTPVRGVEPPPTDQADMAKTFKLTIMDHATSNLTVMVNVELGKPINIMGATLTIEAEPHEPNKVRVVK